MGLVECVNHNLVEPYDVIYEKDGDYVLRTFIPLVTTR